MLYDYDIINSNSKHAKPKIIEYILSLCDKVEFLFQNRLNVDIFSLFDKEEKIFKRSFLSRKDGQSYGMPGEICEFKLTEDIKKYFIDRIDISSGVYLLNNEILLDNPTFLNGNKYVVSNCSHEGMVDINPEYKQQIEDKYLSIVRKDPIYQEMQQKFFSENRSNFSREYNILQDLPIYAEWFNCYFVAHKVENYDYDKYLEIANKYFSDELLYHFNHTIGYNGLFFDNFKERYHNELHYLKILAIKSNIKLDDDNSFF